MPSALRAAAATDQGGSALGSRDAVVAASATLTMLEPFKSEDSAVSHVHRDAERTVVEQLNASLDDDSGQLRLRDFTVAVLKLASTISSVASPDHNCRRMSSGGASPAFDPARSRKFAEGVAPSLIRALKKADF